MKKTFTLIILLATLHLFSQTPPGNWDLVWEDNFDGNYLDSNKWKMGLHWMGIGGSHFFANSGKSIIVENGLLTIRAEKRNEIFAGISKDYASAEISTFKQFKQKYGYLEAKIKYDAVTGVWPAFWMMPDRGVTQTGFWHADAKSYIKFDLNNITTPVASAVFKVKILPQTEENGDYSISVHKIIDNTSWTETNINWTNKPDNDAAFLKQFMGTTNPNLVNQITIGEYIEVDVTNYINDQISKNKQFAGFALMDQFMRENRVEFGSKENPDINNRPILVVDNSNIYPTDDAVVVITNPNNGFGYAERLYICDKWANTSKTDDGGMEMDIMESLGVWGENKVQHALHWDNYGADHKSVSSGRLTIQPTSDGFHTYGMEWSEGKMKFYIDGVFKWSYNNSRVSSVESYLILSHQLGGWNGSGNTSILDSDLPADMIIDYVKVYKSGTLAVDSFLNEKSQNLIIIPNPVKEGNLVFRLKTISSIENIEISITDELGRILYRSSNLVNNNGEMNIQLDKMNLKNGLYFLRVRGIGLSISKKFIY